MLCAGEHIRTEAGLIEVGLEPRTAAQLAAALSHAEASTSPDRVAAMARFDAVLRMDEP